jgi:TonB-dependent receptor
LGSSVQLYNHLADVKGVSVFGVDPKIMDDVLAFQNALYPGEIRNVDPGTTWRVDVKQTTGYVQGNFKGDIGLPLSANIGAKVVKTNLSVNQHKVGDAGLYYANAADLGVIHTERDFTDVLPAVNLALDLRDDLKLRAAYSKNMQLLDLEQWGGGLSLNYGLTSTSQQGVLGGSQGGNPDLKPWRSDNFDVSLEYYFGKSSMISIAAFRINVASFVQGGNTIRCDLPDADGVVRANGTTRSCVSVSGPVQGAGATLQGLEIGLKQAFDFLPGVFGNFGIDANFTYSPSDVGTDVAGNAIPFPDNSREQANLILWYQGKAFQARVAGNYRSKRAVVENFAGLTGFEEYQASTFYLDASASYDFTQNWQMFAQGSNITGEEEHYYLVWPDQKLNTTRFEPRYTLGVRAKF